LGSAVLAGTLALSLVAADGASAATPAGTAATSLSAVSLEVSGADLGNLAGQLGIEIPDIDLDLVNAATYASTDLARSISNAPLALANLVPLSLNGTELGAVAASSDGDATGTSEGVALPSPLGGELGSASAAAAATAESAVAIVTGTLTSLTAVTDS